MCSWACGRLNTKHTRNSSQHNALLTQHKGGRGNKDGNEAVCTKPLYPTRKQTPQNQVDTYPPGQVWPLRDEEMNNLAHSPPSPHSAQNHRTTNKLTHYCGQDAPYSWSCSNYERAPGGGRLCCEDQTRPSRRYIK